MRSRVYGIMGIKAMRSNFNADFTGNPRNLNGVIISTDKAPKFLMRRFWASSGEGKEVFAMRSLNENLNPRSLKERYESLFGELTRSKDVTEVLTNLFSCVDVKNFGVTFAESGYNLAITGVVQINHGINLYEDTHTEILDILSPYRNPNAKKDGSEKNQTTIGELIMADEVHYFFPFSVNPSNFDDFKDVKGFNGYDRTDYEAFKRASRLSATAYKSASRSGVDNEFALFIELNEDSKAYLPNLVEQITFSKGLDGEKDIIDLSKLEFVNDIADEISSIEIYFNPQTTIIKDSFIKEKTFRFNIFTNKKL